MMNEAAEGIYGAKLKDKVGQTVRELISEEHMVTLSKDLSSVLMDQTDPKVEIQSSPDTRKTLQSSTALIQNQDGKVVGMVSILSNVGLEAKGHLHKKGQTSFLDVVVTDSGCGISKEDISRIFEEFEQVGKKNTGMKGTGLGLPIAKALEDQHGGKLLVESDVGRGSKFTVNLPTYHKRFRPIKLQSSLKSQRSWFSSVLPKVFCRKDRR